MVYYCGLSMICSEDCTGDNHGRGKKEYICAYDDKSYMLFDASRNYRDAISAIGLSGHVIDTVYLRMIGDAPVDGDVVRVRIPSKEYLESVNYSVLELLNFLYENN